MVELEEGEGENTWAFICCSVGHCKAFYIHNQNNKIVDITQNNYLYRTDIPLGRLGSYFFNSLEKKNFINLIN